VILVGERLAREGVRPAMDFLLRQRELRLDNYILMVKGDVAEFMGVQLDLEKYPAEALREIMRFRMGTVVTLGDWVRQREARGADPIMGVARVIEPPKGAPTSQKPQLQLMGTALFRNDRLVGVMDERVTRGLMWLRGEIYMGVVTLELPRAPGAISMEYVAARIRRQVRIEDGRVAIYFRIDSEGTISDEQVNLDLGDPKIIVEIEEQMCAEIKRRIDLALRNIRQLQVDSAGLGELVRQRHPSVWKRLANSWQAEEFQRARIVLQVDAKIRRTGLSSQPRGVRAEELIKEAK
jgi:spore germination protein KC